MTFRIFTSMVHGINHVNCIITSLWFTVWKLCLTMCVLENYVIQCFSSTSILSIVWCRTLCHCGGVLSGKGKRTIKVKHNISLLDSMLKWKYDYSWGAGMKREKKNCFAKYLFHTKRKFVLYKQKLLLSHNLLHKQKISSTQTACLSKSFRNSRAVYLEWMVPIHTTKQQYLLINISFRISIKTYGWKKQKGKWVAKIIFVIKHLNALDVFVRRCLSCHL